MNLNDLNQKVTQGSQSVDLFLEQIMGSVNP